MKLLTCAALLGLMASCSSYHVKDVFGVGYSEVPLAADTYKVTFSGNSSDTKDDVYNHFLHRCAEIGTQINKPYFVVESEERESYTHDHGTTSYTDVHAHGNAYGHRFGNSYFGHGDADATATTHTFNNKYKTYDHVGVVRFYSAAKKPAHAYDGNLIMQQFPQDEE